MHADKPFLEESTHYKEGDATMAKAASAPEKPLTKSQIIANIAEKTELTKKDVQAVFDALVDEIKRSVGKKGPGTFTVPGLCKIKRKDVPAKPARKGVMVLGQLRDIPAKKASTTVKVSPLKSLKEMV